MDDAPASVPSSQTDRQPEIQFVMLALGIRAATAHQSDCKCDVMPRDNVHSANVERVARSVPTEKEVPCAAVLLDSL